MIYIASIAVVLITSMCQQISPMQDNKNLGFVMDASAFLVDNLLLVGSYLIVFDNQMAQAVWFFVFC